PALRGVSGADQPAAAGRWDAGPPRPAPLPPPPPLPPAWVCRRRHRRPIGPRAQLDGDGAAGRLSEARAVRLPPPNTTRYPTVQVAPQLTAPRVIELRD